MGNHMTSNSFLDGGLILINCVSEEYSSLIDVPSLPHNIIFLNIYLDIRDNGQVVSVHAKHSLDPMACYHAEQDTYLL
jgi:hypothetical protein